jgi:hypothetical protein
LRNKKSGGKIPPLFLFRRQLNLSETRLYKGMTCIFKKNKKMKKLILAFLIVASLKVNATIYIVTTSVNVTCSVGDTLRFVAGCSGTNQVYINDASGNTLGGTNGNYISPVNTPVTGFLMDYVVTGNEAHWYMDDDIPCAISGTISMAATEIASYNKSENINVFPNPATNKIFVTGIKNAEISIMDYTGKEIKKILLKDESAGISIENLLPGIYFLQMESNKWRVIKKISKE